MAGGDERVDVENQRHPSVAEDRRGGDAWHMPIIALEALHDDLPLIEDRVHQQRAAPAAFGLDEDRDAGERFD